MRTIVDMTMTVVNFIIGINYSTIESRRHIVLTRRTSPRLSIVLEEARGTGVQPKDRCTLIAINCQQVKFISVVSPTRRVDKLASQ